MSILRTIAMFVYLFGYMIVHYGVLRRAERALAAGDMDTVEQIINKHIPHWSRGILKVTGARLVVEGQENIPKDGPCVFVGNHQLLRHPAASGGAGCAPRHPGERGAGKDPSAQPLDEAAGLRFRQARRHPRVR